MRLEILWNQGTSGKLLSLARERVWIEGFLLEDDACDYLLILSVRRAFPGLDRIKIGINLGTYLKVVVFDAKKFPNCV